MKGVVALAVALLIAFAWSDSSGTAYAHAAYESSTPADGEVVAEPPLLVEVFFSQEVARGGGLPTMIVTNESGDQVDLGATLDDADRTRMFVDLPPELPQGRYTVIWHTLSDEDGEEAQGALHFFIGAGPEATTSAPGSATSGETTETPTPDDEDDSSDGISPAIFAIGLLLTAGLAGGAGLFLGRRSSA